MQKMLEAGEIEQSSFVAGLPWAIARGMQQMFENYSRRQGQAATHANAGSQRQRPRSLHGMAQLQLFRPAWSGTIRTTCNHMNRTVPRPAQAAVYTNAVPSWPSCTRAAKSSTNPVIRMLAPALDKVEKADRRKARSISAAWSSPLACEALSFCSTTTSAGRRRLDELGPGEGCSRAVPTDPIDNQPLRYRAHQRRASPSTRSALRPEGRSGEHQPRALWDRSGRGPGFSACGTRNLRRRAPVCRRWDFPAGGALRPVAKRLPSHWRSHESLDHCHPCCKKSPLAPAVAGGCARQSSSASRWRS